MSKVTVVAKIVAKKESVEAVMNALINVIAPTRKEGGCLEYYLHRDNENPALFMFYENWKNEDELENHMKTPHFKTLVDAIGSITEEISMNKLTRIEKS